LAGVGRIKATDKFIQDSGKQLYERMAGAEVMEFAVFIVEATKHEWPVCKLKLLCDPTADRQTAARAGASASRTSRILRARVLSENGFCRKRVVTSMAPWRWTVVSA